MGAYSFFFFLNVDNHLDRKVGEMTFIHSCFSYTAAAEISKNQNMCDDSNINLASER